MANDWFRFKQFTVQQDKCAMKVSTDACIQGAYAARYLKQYAARGKLWHVLDIGTGTGLLSLMITQEVNAMIDAVEIDGAACQQAEDNFENSKWCTRLKMYNQDIGNFASDKQYDLIICNPPFFNNSLKNKSIGKTMARHDDTMPQALLAQLVNRHLTADGFFCVMYPTVEWSSWMHAATAAGLHLVQQLSVKPKNDQHSNRQIGMFYKGGAVAVYKDELVIYEADGSYSKQFVTLMKDYYLNL